MQQSERLFFEKLCTEMAQTKKSRFAFLPFKIKKERLSSLLFTKHHYRRKLLFVYILLICLHDQLLEDVVEVLRLNGL